jgi:hypothetical protein
MTDSVGNPDFSGLSSLGVTTGKDPLSTGNNFASLSSFGSNDANAPQDNSFLKFMDTDFSGEQGGTNFLGNLNTGLSAAGNLFKMYSGLKQLGLAREQLDFSRSAFDTNLQNQGRLTNARLEDRQARRVRDRPDQNLSVADYMARFGVSENRNI